MVRIVNNIAGTAICFFVLAVQFFACMNITKPTLFFEKSLKLQFKKLYNKM